MRALPNILTFGRLVLTLVVLLALTIAALTKDAARLDLYALAFVAFAVAAVTDFLDGWLARKLKAESLLGAILDPIADKALVAAAIVGLIASGQPSLALPGGLILVRELAVSALRETLAPKGLRLEVTLLAKWKTTLQLLALGAALFLLGWSFWDLPCDPELQSRAWTWADALVWIATAVTLWTGIEYALSARRALKG